MLKPINAYIDEINKKILEECYYNLEYQHYFFGQGNWLLKDPTYDDSDFNKFGFVSVTIDPVTKEEKILGYISYYINQVYRKAVDFGALSFERNNIVFAVDCLQVIHDVFLKYKVNKIMINASEDNKAARSYQRLFEKIGGKQVALYEDDIRLLDGNYHNTVVFECLRRNFIPVQNKKIHISPMDLMDLKIFQAKESQSNLTLLMGLERFNMNKREVNHDEQ